MPHGRVADALCADVQSSPVPRRGQFPPALRGAAALLSAGHLFGTFGTKRSRRCGTTNSRVTILQGNQMDRSGTLRYLYRLSAIAALLLTVTQAHAQNFSDSGTFEIRASGKLIGTEKFKISRTGTNWESSAELAIKMG